MEPGKSRPASKMSPNHRRVLSVRLRLLEDYGLQLHELLRPVESAFTSRPALPPEKAEKLNSALLAFRSRIRRIKTELELEHHHQNVKREAMALVATMMNSVEELHPRYLDGYGNVPDPLAAYLQGCLPDLSKALDAANRILADDSEKHSPPAPNREGSSDG
ncbi:MAG TPA: hypothetical protein VMW54_02120 [Terriglobia bacterium]|nr:hypothetical protein [Terriglobia bacterium]